MTDRNASDRHPGITVITAPRGAGKSHFLARSIAEARARGESTRWIDDPDSAGQDLIAPADLIVIDAVDAHAPAHVALLRSAVAAIRRGIVKRVMIASRSSAILDHHTHPWLHDYTTMTADALAVDSRQVAAMGNLVGRSVSDDDADVIADESDGWVWAAAIGIAATRDPLRARAGSLRNSMRQRIRDAIIEQLTHQQRLIFTATTIIRPRTLRAAGIADPDGWFALAESEGWVTRDAADPYYRVPAAITRALRSMPDEAPDALVALRSQLVHACLEDASYAEAIDIALASDEAELIDDVARHMARVGRVSDVYRIATALKGRELSWFGTHTDLLGAAALMGRGTGRRYADWLQAAREVLKSVPTTAAQTPTDQLYALAIRIVAHRAVGDLTASTTNAKLAFTTWNRARTRMPAAAGAAALALNSAAVTFTLNNEYIRALNAVSEAIDCAKAIGDPALEYINVSTKLTIHALHGDLAAAAATLRELPDTDERERPPLTLGRVGRALLAAELGDMRSARAHVDSTMDLQRDTELWWLALYAHAAVDSRHGSPRTSQAYDDATRDGVRRGFMINAPAFHRLRLSELQIASGQLARARATLSQVASDVPQAHLLNGVIELASEDWQTARAHARLTHADSTPRMTVTRGLVMAAATAAMGHDARAAAHLDSTLEQMIRWELGSPLRFFTDTARDLLRSTSDNLGAHHRAFFAAQISAHPALSVVRGTSAALSSREAEVIRLLGAGARVVDIASALGISQNTVKTLARRLYQKLGARTREEAIDNAYEAGLLDEDLP